MKLQNRAVFFCLFGNKSDDYSYLYIRYLKTPGLKPVFLFTILIWLCECRLRHLDGYCEVEKQVSNVRIYDFWCINEYIFSYKKRHLWDANFYLHSFFGVNVKTFIYKYKYNYIICTECTVYTVYIQYIKCTYPLITY